MRVKCLAQKHNAVPKPRIEPGPLDTESITLTTIDVDLAKPKSGAQNC